MRSRRCARPARACIELRRPERRAAPRRAERAPVRDLACARRCCSRSRRPTACCTRATCRSRRSRRRGSPRSPRSRSRRRSSPCAPGGGSGCSALAPAALAAAWVSAGRWPSPGAPLGGLAGLARRCALGLGAGRAAVRARRAPRAARGRAGRALRLARGARVALARAPASARRGPARDRCRSRSARPSTTCRRTPGERSPRARSLLAFLRTGRPAGGGPALAAGVRGARAARRRRAGAPCPPPRGRRCCRGRPGRSRTTRRRRRRSTSSGTCATSRSSFRPKPVEVLQVRAPRPSYWRAVVLGRLRRPALRARSRRRSSTRAAHGGVVRVPARPRAARAARRGRRSRRSSDSFLVAPGPARALRAAGRGRGRRPRARTARRSSASRPSAGLALRRRGRRARSLGDGAARAARRAIRPRVAGAISASPASALPAFGTAGRERALAALFRAHRGDPAVARLAAAPTRRRAPSRAAPRRRTRRSSRSRPGCARRAPTTSTRACPTAPDALARWAAAGTAGYCQMFAASLAALARLSGVPARVAEGFAPGDLRGGVYHVTDRDAHAWVEAWFPGYGWLPFDATPGRASPRARVVVLARRSTAPRRRRAPAGGGEPRPAAPAAAARRGCARRSARRGAAARAAGAPGGAARPALALALLAALLARAPCSRKRALLRLALPRDPARRGARSACARSPPIRALELGAGAHAARARRARSSARFGVDARRVRDRARARGLRRAGRPARDAALERETDGLLRALRGVARRAAPRGCAARSPSRLSAARGRAR